MSSESVDLIRKLLKYDPKERLGVKGGYEEIKNHPFFSTINWENIDKGISPLKTFAEKYSVKASTKIKVPEIEETPINTKMVEPKIDGITYMGDG